jgi:hypothetical protein
MSRVWGSNALKGDRTSRWKEIRIFTAAKREFKKDAMGSVTRETERPRLLDELSACSTASIASYCWGVGRPGTLRMEDALLRRAEG